VDPRTLLARWRDLLVNAKALSIEEADGHDWSEEPPPYVFHALRPDGALVPELFRGVEHGDEMASRLMSIYEAACKDDGHVYFIVQAPPPATRAQAERWMREHCAKLLELAEALGAEEEFPHEMAVWRAGPPIVFVERLESRDPGAEPSSLRSLHYHLTTELDPFASASEHTQWLLEPLYYIACDYGLAHWVLWPHLRESSGLADPFGPYFELWHHGIEFEFSEVDEILIAMPPAR
jgi:hypothetical protein